MRLESPAAGKNLPPITAQLSELLPTTGTVLEVASGPGQHVTSFARSFPDLVWQPSDVDPRSLESVAAWTDADLADRILPPVLLDVSQPDWPVQVRGPFDAIIAINLIHISPWAAATGLLDGASQVLAPGGALILYGPFMRGGEHTAPSNAAFDQSLRAQNPAWGVRDVDELNRAAASAGLSAADWHEMPSNNAMLRFRLRVPC